MKKGFTLIEVCITLAVFFLVLPLTFMVMGKVYTHSARIKTLNDMKQSSAEIYAKIQGDMGRNHTVEVKGDNHGISIQDPGGAIDYVFEKSSIYRKKGGVSTPVGSSPVDDATFVLHAQDLTINLVFSSVNSVTRKTETLKTMESLPLR